MITMYDRHAGVPEGHMCLYKILSFGDQGGSRYEDKIICSSERKEDLIDFCLANEINLGGIDGDWKEFFIK